MWRKIYISLIDLYLIVIATVCASAIRDNLDFSTDKILTILPYVGWTILASLVVLPVSNMSRSIWRFSTMVDYTRVIATVFAIVLTSVAMGFLFNRLDAVARTLPILQGILMVCMLVGARVSFRLYHARRQKKPKLLDVSVSMNGQAVLLVGINRISELYLQSIREFAAGRVRVAGLLGQTGRHTGRLLQTIPILGRPEDADAILKELAVRGIVVERIVVTMAFDRLSKDAQAALLDIQQRMNVQLDCFGERLLLDERKTDTTVLVTATTAKPTSALMAQPVCGETADFVITPDALKVLSSRPYWLVKRGMDFLAAGILLIVFAPLLLAVAAVVALDVGLPVTFWQQRPGLGGLKFRLFKFRTMAAAYDGRGQRLPDDARLSAIGAFLRRTRLDELPQLIHILNGEMSFVGPRPLLPIDQSPAHSARLLVRPGMTGWAQVAGGRGISLADKAALDVWYVNNASLRLDLRIVLRTIPMVVVGERIDDCAIRDAWQALEDSQICKPAVVPPQYRRDRADFSRSERSGLNVNPGAPLPNSPSFETAVRNDALQQAVVIRRNMERH
jgi:lipopolysaccharide/colanic/teichoic acid biosynthesis glycosyltransferase